MSKRRRSPRKHQVHPRHPRYQVSQYPRGQDPPYMERMRKLHLKTVDDTLWQRVYHDEGGAHIHVTDDMGNLQKLYVRELDKVARGNIFEVPDSHPNSFISHRDPTKHPNNEEIGKWDSGKLEAYAQEYNEKHHSIHAKNRDIEEALRNTPNLPRDQYVEIRRQLEKNNREMAEIRGVLHQIGAIQRQNAWKSAKPPSIKPKVFMLRSTIGHYGGRFVDVPAEEFNAFRDKFDKRAFPRGESIRNTTYGEFAYTTVFFDEGTKSSKRLEALERKGVITLKYS